MATLGLAGLRISEMADLRVAQVDLQGGRLELFYAKTDAGVREVEISLYLRDELLRDELLEHVMDRQTRNRPMRPSDHFFGTATGCRHDHDRFRDRILACSVQRANAIRFEQGLAPPLAHLTRCDAPGRRSAATPSGSRR